MLSFLLGDYVRQKYTFILCTEVHQNYAVTDGRERVLLTGVVCMDLWMRQPLLSLGNFIHSTEPLWHSKLALPNNVLVSNIPMTVVPQFIMELKNSCCLVMLQLP